MSAGRDPRAWWLDDDPFDKKESKERNNNIRSSKSTFYSEQNTFQDIMNDYFGAQERYSIPIHKGSIWHFSKIEIKHLSQATLAFTLALAFLGTRGIFGAIASPTYFIYWGILYFISLTPAFLLHEIAHKIVARKYGCWAEFRANPAGLRFGVILAAALGIVFMAPGAVMVSGRTTRSQFGRIALAGPVTNISLWCFGIFTAFIMGGFNSHLDQIITTWLWGNSILAAFNMLPFGPLDGKKIKIWSENTFYVWLTISLATIWITLNYVSTILSL
jgi:Zn-dependent protease